ncbi:hypothetical protein ACTMSW_21325 [Micromonospora sp. BQ11]|uniref:hypothetical protein n=1 Tax=Micromonospora sp. BQ11 TaxID=3452212 RepID=UPI003F8B6C0A
MIKRWRRRPAAMLLVLALTGCSVGDIRRDPPVRSAAPTAPPATRSAAPPPVAVAETRAARVAVPKGYDPPRVEFVDVTQGYALFASCGERPPGRDCPVLLYATTDGGRHWRKLRHPRPVADGQQMYTASGVLTLLSEPYGWWTSIDGGATFRHTPGEAAPPEWRAAQGRFQVVEETGGVGRWDGRTLRRLPAQPDLPALNTVTERHGVLVAAGARDGRAYAAVSTDQGRSWRTTPVPESDGAVELVRAQNAPDGDLWLVGDRGDRVSFPALWRWADGWQPVRAVGHPERAHSTVPLGGGLLATNGPSGAGVVRGDRYEPLPWPVKDTHYLLMLADGGLAAVAPDEVLLGTGRHTTRTWAKVTIDIA